MARFGLLALAENKKKVRKQRHFPLDCVQSQRVFPQAIVISASRFAKGWLHFQQELLECVDATVAWIRHAV